MNRKHLGWAALKATAGIAARHLLRGQTNFVRMLWKFNSVYNATLQLADHQLPVTYEMALPTPVTEPVSPQRLYIHTARGGRSRAIEEATERFIDEGRMAVPAGASEARSEP